MPQNKGHLAGLSHATGRRFRKHHMRGITQPHQRRRPCWHPSFAGNDPAQILTIWCWWSTTDHGWSCWVRKDLKLPAEDARLPADCQLFPGFLPMVDVDPTLQARADRHVALPPQPRPMSGERCMRAALVLGSLCSPTNLDNILLWLALCVIPETAKCNIDFIYYHNSAGQQPGILAHPRQESH